MGAHAHTCITYKQVKKIFKIKKCELIKLVLGSKMAINYIKTVGASVSQPCLLDLEALPKGRDRRLGITRYLLVRLSLPVWGMLGCGWLPVFCQCLLAGTS